MNPIYRQQAGELGRALAERNIALVYGGAKVGLMQACADATLAAGGRDAVPAAVAADSLLRAIRGADKVAITGARLFDRFETPDGLSLAFEVTLQPVEKSFTEEQMGEISKRIVAAAEKLGARLRS